MIGIVLQARMGSTRLPGKILKPIGNKILLDHIYYRVSLMRHMVKVVLATSVEKADDVVAEYCLKAGRPCYRGSESDVLARYYHCASEFGLDPIIRLTGDNPFVDVEELDRLIELYFNVKPDYAYSFGQLPVGVGAEMFSFDALEKSYRMGLKPHHREHVNEFILENPQIFSSSQLEVPKSKRHPEVRLTVDTPDDYRKACYIVANSANELISTEEAIDLCMRFV